MVREKLAGLKDSVSYTTRPKRPGERDGVDYHFMNEKDFNTRKDKGFFAEWARVHEYYYGTSREDLDAIIDKGHDAIMDIDVQGARQLKKSFPDSVSVFILPPSLRELENRLKQRGTEDDESIQKRLEAAVDEMKSLSVYDYLVVNRDLLSSSSQLESIIAAERSKASRCNTIGLFQEIISDRDITK